MQTVINTWQEDDMTRLILAVLLIFTTGNVFAYPKVAQAKIGVYWLLAACDETDESSMAKGYCKGYIEGVRNNMQQWCVPENVTIGELDSYVVAALRLLKHDLKDDGFIIASDAIVKVISDRWPCD